MSTHKNIDKICVAVMVLALVITVLFMNAEKFGVTVIRDEDSESYEDSYEGSEYFTKNDVNGDWDTSEATVITLSDDDIDISGSGVYVNGNDVVIAMSGEYVISGELSDGSITVDANDNSKVFIMLNGVSVNCSDDAAFTVSQADKVFMTLAEGSVNSFSSGEAYSDEAVADGAGGVIYAHDDLTINGSGELNITASYKHGIEANDDLTITGGKINITAPKDGITVNEEFAMKDADITITVDDDAVHADDEIYIESGTLLVNSCYEGLEGPYITIAGGDITIYPSDDGLNASDGSSSGFGMMGPMGGMDHASDEEDGDEDDETTLPYVHITGGKLTIINENAQDADGIDSNGDIIIDGGDIFVNLKGSGTNNALDYGSESGGICEINGGNVIACGGYNMAESADATSKQVSIMYTISSGIDAGETVYLEDADENVIMEFTLECSATCLIMSCPELTTDATYLFVTGDNVDELTVTEVSATYGDSQSSMFGGSMNFGNMMHMADFRQKRDSEGGGHGGGMGHGGPGRSEASTSSDESKSDSDGKMEKPEGEEPPAKPEGDEAPEMPDGEAPDMGDMTPPDMSEGEMPEMPDGMEAPEGMEDMEAPEGMEGMTPPDMEQGGGPGGDMGQGGPGGDMPGMETSEDEETDTGHSITEYDASAWLIYGGCFALALAGVIIAVVYKRRRY